MPAFPRSIARAAASLCEEIWNSLSGENRGWNHLDRWLQSYMLVKDILSLDLVRRKTSI